MTRKFSLTIQLTLAAGLLVLASSCNKPDQQAGATRIQKITSADESIEFQYHTDGSVKTVTLSDDVVTGGESRTYTVAYHSNKQIRELRGNDGTVLTPVYSNGVLDRTDIKMGGQTISRFEYEFLNGQLKSALVKFNQGGTFLTVMKIGFQYGTNANVSRSSMWFGNPLTNQLEFSGQSDMTYDDKENPLFPLKDLLTVLLQRVTRNNVVREVEQDENGQVVETREYAYTYNANGLPATANVRATQPGAQPVTTTIAYTYR